MASTLNLNNIHVTAVKGPAGPPKGTLIEYVYREVMYAVYLNRNITHRHEVLCQQGYKVLLFHRSGYGLDLLNRTTRNAFAIVGKLGSINFDSSSYSIHPQLSAATKEMSFYIQISGSETLRKDRYKERLVAFVEITQSELRQRIRRLKLQQLYGT